MYSVTRCSASGVTTYYLMWDGIVVDKSVSRAWINSQYCKFVGMVS